MNGSDTYNRPSRFVQEIPDDLIQEVRLSNSVSRPVHGGSGARYREHDDAGDDIGLKLGQRVLHPKFGEGVVMNYEGQGKQARVQVNFEGGSKWLVMSYANLETIG